MANKVRKPDIAPAIEAVYVLVTSLIVLVGVPIPLKFQKCKIPAGSQDSDSAKTPDICLTIYSLYL